MARQREYRTVGEDLKNKPPPGFRLRHILRGHEEPIGRIAWSPDGRILGSPSSDGTVRLWDPETGQARETIDGRVAFSSIHAAEKTWKPFFTSLAWSPDGQMFAVASADRRVRVWDMRSRQLHHMLYGHDDCVTCVSWSPDGGTIASGSDDSTIRLWDVITGRQELTIIGNNWITGVAWSPDGLTLASSCEDSTLQLWEAKTGKVKTVLRGHDGRVTNLTWSPSGQMLASCSFDRTVRIWDPGTGKQIAILEGHTNTVRSVCFSGDEHLLASKSWDGTIRLWSGDTRELLHVFSETASRNWAASLAFHPRASLLATLGEEDTVIRIWEMDMAVLFGLIRSTLFSDRTAIRTAAASSVRYANAKVVLVGDTGVAKSGLGVVLCGQHFIPTESTHGRHVWVFDDREVPLERGRAESREILLWDLAGQPGYRLIHQLHLGDVALAIIVFDARSEIDAFAGVRHWERALRQAQRAQGDSALPLKKFLVAARADRGGAGLSVARIEALVRDLGFDGYFETSAKEGWHIPELAEAIRKAIDWDALPRVSSTALFQNIKALLLEEKKARQLLPTTQDLYRTFLKSQDAPPDSDDLHAQFTTCVGRVESQGLIRRLSFGDLVLLQPELLDAYASALINAAKDEPDGLGSIAEEDVRAGRFRMPADQRIPDPTQEKLLLIAMIEDLLLHDIALREPADDGPYLVFPSQLTREYPNLTDPEGRTVIFAFEGPVLNVYATLAVRLARSGLFKRKEMWKNAATYTATVGGTCGVFLREVEEGRGELTLLFDPAASKETRFQFEDYVHTHLKRRALPESIQRRRILVCSNPDCATPLTDLQVRRRLERGFDWIECNVCGERVALTDRKEPPAVTTPSSVPEMDRAADAHRDLEAGLVSASGEMGTQEFRDWAGAAQTMLALVFTDIVDSTALSNELGNEAMNEVRRDHFERGRKWLQKQGGYEIKTMGDSLMVAFRTAVEALNFALVFHGDTGHEQVRIRVGLHVGHVHIEEGDAYGAMVNYTARVQARAEQPEIWLSDRAKGDLDEVKAKAHRRLRWTEHPGCGLKGFAGTHRLWSVAAS